MSHILINFIFLSLTVSNYNFNLSISSMNSLNISAHSWLFFLYFNRFLSYLSHKLLYCYYHYRHSCFSSRYSFYQFVTLLLITSKLFFSSISLWDAKDLRSYNSSSNSWLYSRNPSFSFLNSPINCFKLPISFLNFSSFDANWCKFFKELAVNCYYLNLFKSFFNSSICLLYTLSVFSLPISWFYLFNFDIFLSADYL